MMGRQNHIEFYRFVAAMIIMVFHSFWVGDQIWLNGYVFVDFFFLLTGYFTYAHLVRLSESGDERLKESTYPIQYTWNKMKKLIPYMAITAGTFYVGYTGVLLYRGAALKDILKSFVGAPFDMFLLQVVANYGYPLFDAWWYLSALLFGLPIVITLFKKSIGGGGASKWAMIFLPAMLYGYFTLSGQYLDWQAVVFFVRLGFFRGIAGCLLGGDVYCLARKLEEREVGKFGETLFTVAEIGCFLATLALTNECYTLTNSAYLMIFFFFCMLVISFSGKSYVRYLNFRFFGFLGKLSVPLYICHFSIGRLVQLFAAYYPENVTERRVIYWLISLGYALLIYFIVFMVRKRKNYADVR